MPPFLCAAAAAIGPAGRDRSALFAEAEGQIARLAGRGADLVVLPELFALPYVAGADPRDWPLGETLAGETGRWSSRTARRYGVHLVFGMALNVGGEKPLNAAVLARPDGTLAHVASKMDLPPPLAGDRFGEADHFAPGPRRVAAFEIGAFRIAVLVCYDRRLAQNWRMAADADADAVLILVAGPAPDDPPDHYAQEIRMHAAACRVYALAAARTGVETLLGRTVWHDGTTLAVNPFGRLIGEGRGSADDTTMMHIAGDVLAAARNELTTTGRTE